MSPTHGPADGGVRADPPTPSRIHAQRVVTRRLESALIGRDPHADPSGADPGRTRRRALGVGAALGALALGVAAVVGVVRGDADWRAAVIVRGTPSGALYVVAHGPDRLVPTTDLPSARLLAAGVDPDRADPGTASSAGGDPTPVRDDALLSAPRTAPAGLAGAPSQLPDAGTAPVPNVWAVCDAVRGQDPGPGAPAGPADPAAQRRATAVLGGFPALGRALGGDEAVLVRGDDGVTWLVADGRRVALDPTQGAVVRALGIAGEPARVAGAALLGALPQGAPLVPPRVVGAGLPPTDPGTRALGLVIGSVARTGPPAAARYLLVLDRGVQEVPAVLAQLVRFAAPTPDAGPDIATVPATTADRLPRTVGVDPGAYPRTFPRLLGVDAAPVVCARPSARPGGPTAITVAGTLPSPVPPTPASDPTIPGPRAVDAVRVAGPGAYVVPVGPGELPDPERGVVVDTVGRVFPVAGVRAATALGLRPPVAAPRSVVGLLPRGPVLDLDAARTLR